MAAIEAPAGRVMQIFKMLGDASQSLYRGLGQIEALTEIPQKTS
jgi:hypothetical protein